MQPALDECCPSLRDVQFKVGFKNAVPVGFFGECAASRLLGAETDVIVLEASNVWNSNLRLLVQQLRHAAPRAIISFLAWPTRHVVGYALRARIPYAEKGHATRQRLLEAAHAEQADVLDATDLIVRMFASWGRTRRLGQADLNLFYAQRGADVAHPSPAGHALLGAFVANYIGEQLRRTARKASTDGVRATAASAATWQSPPANASVTPPPWEVCYDDANEMPVAHDGGWTLRDEGSAEKGIKKMGWVSTVPDQTLKLGPMLAVPASTSCSLSFARLGYLMSSYTTTGYIHGAINLSCSDCMCSQMGGYFSSSQTPFPTFQTNGSIASDGSITGMNASITAFTQFLVFQSGPRPCFIEAKHLVGKGAGSPRIRRVVPLKSKVQINGLQMHSAMDPESIVLLYKRAWVATKDKTYRSFALAVLECVRASLIGDEIRAALCSLEAVQERRHPRKALDTSGIRTPQNLRAIINEAIALTQNATLRLCELLDLDHDYRQVVSSMPESNRWVA